MTGKRYTQKEVEEKLKQFNLVLIDPYKTLSTKTKVRCFCGNVFETRLNSVFQQTTKSCGCLYKNHDWCWTGTGEISGSFWCMLKASAKTRGIKFSITADQILKKFIDQDKKCAISGVDIAFARNWNKDKHLQTASLDRIDSNGDYSISNVQWVHKDVNFMKLKMSDEKLIEWCNIIALYNK